MVRAAALGRWCSLRAAGRKLPGDVFPLWALLANGTAKTWSEGEDYTVQQGRQMRKKKARDASMLHGWNSTTLTSEAESLELLLELWGKGWLCRGQSKRYARLVPSIDRDRLNNLSRVEKLTFERRSIDLFRSTAHF